MIVSAILLAGGVGRRLGAPTPKQYLPIQGKPMALYSYETLLRSPCIHEVVVVCGKDFQDFFPDHPKLRFADPGERRQDSVFNGMKASRHPLLCIHDAARPFLRTGLLDEVLEAGHQHGAAVLAIPVKSTIKTGRDGFVTTTLPRETLWDVQTPQVIRRDWLEAGFQEADRTGATVTDDVSLAELLGHPVKLVEGHDCLMKVTTPADLQIAEALL